MKKIYMLLMIMVLAMVLSACSASTANISAANLGTGYDSGTSAVTGASTTFGLAEPEIHLVASFANVPDGTTTKAVLTAVDVTDMNGSAIKDTMVNEIAKTLTSDSTVDFKFSIPSTGEWPVGSYKIDLYLNEKIDRTITFTINE